MYGPSVRIKNLPTHANFTEFLATLLPFHAQDVRPIYHEPRYHSYNPSNTTIDDIVLSITPTTGVYTKLAELASLKPLRRKPACFLHRPFNLDRRAVPWGSIVQASHKRFDELLTVGWNTALAERLGLDLSTAVCIQGYKADPDRRIGLVARFLNDKVHSLGQVHKLIIREFGVGHIVHSTDDGTNLDIRVHGVAIMNAFGPDEVARAVNCAIQLCVIEQNHYANLLYLTGEPKALGVAAVKEKYQGMSVVCVGHQLAVEWGIHFLGSRLKQLWPDVGVHVVIEDEEVPNTQKT